MKKIIFLFLLIVCFMPSRLFSQYTKYIENQDIYKKNKVKVISEYKNENEQKVLISIKEYNSKGQIIKETGYSTDGNKNVMDMIYENNLLKEINSKESNFITVKFYYNSSKRLIKVIEGDDVTTYDYDAKGNMTEELLLQSGTAPYRFSYEYNSDNRLIKSYSKFGESTYYYNDDGTLKQVVSVDDVEDYVYNDKKLLINEKSSWYDDGKLSFSNEKVYEYEYYTN